MTEESPDLPPKFNLAVWRRIYAHARPFLPNIALLLTLGVLVAAFDAAIPFFNGLLIDKVAHHAPQSEITRNFILYALMMASFSASIWAFIMVAGSISTGFAYTLRNKAFAHLQSLSFSFYDKKAVGWLMARMTSDIGTLARTLAWSQLDLAWGLTVLPFCAAMMLFLHWKLALLVLITWPILIVVSLVFQKRMLLINRKLRKANSITTAAYNEGLLGARTTKSMGREDKNLAEFKLLTDTQYSLSLRNALYNALFVPLLTSICFAGVALALYQGGHDAFLSSKTGFSVGTLFSFIQYATFIQFPVQQLAQTATNIQSAQVSVERIQSLLDTPPEISDARTNDQLPMTNDPIQRIEFRNVSFGYSPTHLVLKNFNLTVSAGDSIALVGPTGGGKSTIVSLACRFYEPNEVGGGQILINGADYRTLPLAYLQSRLGMVLQQPHLFSGSISDNIRYGRLEATPEEIQQAAQLAGAHDFIQSFPDTYNTKVGEGGNRLSTGQKQLISLARAIIANPQIFVMDEATSSVDTQTERAIQSAVDKVLQGRISFVIAHRLSTIKRATKILVISNGELVEQGSHHDLLALKGKYYDLYTNQFTHEHEDQLLHSAPEPATST